MAFSVCCRVNYLRLALNKSDILPLVKKYNKSILQIAVLDGQAAGLLIYIAWQRGHNKPVMHLPG
jgi:hypothetical protein